MDSLEVELFGRLADWQSPQLLLVCRLKYSLWADRPGQARPRGGAVESLHWSVAGATLD